MFAIMEHRFLSGSGERPGTPRRLSAVRRACACLAMLALAAAVAGAQNLKFASVAPKDTVWDVALNQIGAEWHRLSGGDIEVTVFPGGVAGDETDLLRKVRTGQLDAVAISAIGLATVYPGVLALGMPFLFENEEEVAYATEQLRPLIEDEFERRGFKMLMWTAAGWVHFFSREPILTPDDLRQQKLNVPDANPGVVSAWQDIGFRIAELPVTEVAFGLQNGFVDAVLNTSLIVAPMQWFGVAKHMNALEIAPFYGAMLISTRTWRRFPEDLRPQLFAAVQEYGGEATAQVLAAERAAVEIMRRFGLTIHQPTAEEAAEWRVLQRGFESLVGPVVDERAFEVVVEALAEYRAGRAASP